MYKLSVCMMVKNEEKNMKRCLDSLKNLVQKVPTEIIIVDTGSTDRTVEIAREYTDKVYFHPWNNHFAEMRNITLDYATGEWLFILDADEELIEDRGLVKFIKTKQPVDIVGAAFTLRNVGDLEGTFFSSEMVTPRLFRKTAGLRFEGSVHNMPIVKGNLQFIDTLLNHYGYIAEDKDLMERKFLRTKELLLNELSKDPLSVYYRYQLSTTYAMHGDALEAYTESKRAYELIQGSDELMWEHLYVLSAYAKDAMHLGKHEEVISVCEKGIALEPEYIDLYFFMSTSLSMLGNAQEAITSYEKYLKLVENFDGLKIKYNAAVQHYMIHRQDEAYCNLAVNFLRIKDYERCYYYASKIINTLSPDSMYYQGVFKSHQISLMKLNKYDETARMLEKGTFDIVVVATIEEELQTLDQAERSIVFDAISKAQHPYAKVLELRSGIKTTYKNYEDLLVENLSKINFSDCPEYLYEILYYGFKQKLLVKGLFSSMAEDRAIEIINWLDEHFKDFDLVAKNYIELIGEETITELDEKRILAKYRMYKNLNSKAEKDCVEQYFAYANAYIRSKYTDEYIRTANVYSGKNHEETYLLMICREMNLEMNAERIKHYESITKLFPAMECVTRYLLNEFLEMEAAALQETAESSPLRAEFIKQIRILMSVKEYENAIMMIDEYLKQFPSDLEMLGIKSEIFIMQVEQGQSTKN